MSVTMRAFYVRQHVNALFTPSSSPARHSARFTKSGNSWEVGWLKALSPERVSSVIKSDAGDVMVMELISVTVIQFSASTPVELKPADEKTI
jgi:hypothetical protein